VVVILSAKIIMIIQSCYCKCNTVCWRWFFSVKGFKFVIVRSIGYC